MTVNMVAVRSLGDNGNSPQVVQHRWCHHCSYSALLCVIATY